MRAGQASGHARQHPPALPARSPASHHSTSHAAGLNAICTPFFLAVPPVLSSAGKGTRGMGAPLDNRGGAGMVAEGKGRGGGPAPVPHLQAAVSGACGGAGMGGRHAVSMLCCNAHAAKAGRYVQQDGRAQSMHGRPRARCQERVAARPGDKCTVWMRSQSNYNKRLPQAASAGRGALAQQHKTCGRGRSAAAVAAALQKKMLVIDRLRGLRFKGSPQ